MINDNILKIALNTNNYGLKDIFTHKSILKNSKCGDKIHVELIVKKNKISSMRYETESCIFCQASASILAKSIKLFSVNDIKENINYIKDCIKMKKNFLPKKLKIFKEIVHYKNINRIDCIMLPFNALIKALKI